MTWIDAPAHRPRTPAPVPRHLAGISVARARARALVERPGPFDDDAVLVRDTTVRGAAGPLPARTYRPRAGGRGVVLFLHGGGWALGDLDTDDAVCRRIAADAGTAVLGLGYRLAPEHPHPAALEDASAVLRALADRGAGGVGGPGEPLAVAGAEAGAQLAAVLALRSRAGSVPPLAHQVLLCPVLDSDLTRPSHREHGHGPELTVEDLAWFWRMHVPDRAARRRPDVSPLRVPDPTGLAPATLVVAGADPLRDEGLAHAGRLTAAGVDAHRVLAGDARHGFATRPGSPDADAALRAVTDRLRPALAPAARTAAGARVIDLRAPVRVAGARSAP
ncbi:alpha/beta hydrolase [Kineococcus radiotolerans]|uniref:Alpha/beta hydrolase fold-3 domain protein n=1 Tax=Kineococcus radiotolerans (strain ATCC BAA-149 / DSM 14245 / SRS30216) TaxID=266940 RepID=A6WG74_KINRD|nr:alpha/beta hydrolase [Kineococcus radiotolerans]ABS05813.1 Alpha/beta hydrolase fold-3 domain protein [Kineococcus radiotolerans SRS30216 = ATCC BAA-149]